MAEIEAVAAEALRMAGDTTALAGWAPVGGGMISQTARVRSGRGEYLLKWGDRGLPGFFAAEARGLELLAATGALRVPGVLAYHDPTTDHRPPTTDHQESEDRGSKIEDRGSLSSILDPRSSIFGLSSVVDTGFILLEWLDPPPRADRRAAFELLGRGLAALHRATAPACGLDHDNYLGVMPQRNRWMASWVEFFRECRLRPQGELARRGGRMSGARARRFDQLLERLDGWLAGHTPPAALLHGDLWGGNVLIGPGGAPALIDPAVSYGDREAELAYTALFGGFPDSFYRAYEEAWPLPDGWRERRDLYNLYHLINHLNHFGESYGASVDAVLRRYTG